jgi:hypothetical protein
MKPHSALIGSTTWACYVLRYDATSHDPFEESNWSGFFAHHFIDLGRLQKQYGFDCCRHG